MSATNTPTPEAREEHLKRLHEAEAVRITGFFSGRSELVVSALILILATAVAVGTVTMDVMGDTIPGPQFFPTIVYLLLYVLGVLHAISVIRTRRFPHGADPRSHDFSVDMLAEIGDSERETVIGKSSQRPRTTGRMRAYSDWKTVGWVVGGIVLFIVMLPVLGWIISAAGLFWAVCKAFGSARPVFDVGVALLFSSITYLAFNVGLGLNLPAGFLEGAL
ncbi:tripartite tricarboxylate transporter TctB family protein [Zhihengliuella halotolerans]|uniref:tripartite tricarboxylate transporter TctB family protein n=1 Tax=Zhihengliuella halotolerans TaxID=370736 RepID=UPI001C666ADC|nr:tripartite tricarboxylate transporter TctB family protein [Zhihengliuella halotolerans]